MCVSGSILQQYCSEAQDCDGGESFCRGIFTGGILPRVRRRHYYLPQVTPNWLSMTAINLYVVLDPSPYSEDSLKALRSTDVINVLWLDG